VAIKVLDKSKLQCDLDLIASEVATLNELDHPNIVKYFETYNDFRYVYLVMEFVKGKVLFKHLASRSHPSEQLICNYFQQIVSSITHCHA
jgi:calcium-dependent protein kinase